MSRYVSGYERPSLEERRSVAARKRLRFAQYMVAQGKATPRERALVADYEQRCRVLEERRRRRESERRAQQRTTTAALSGLYTKGGA